MKNWQALKAIKEGYKVSNHKMKQGSFLHCKNNKLYMGFQGSNMEIQVFGEEFWDDRIEWFIAEEEMAYVH